MKKGQWFKFEKINKVTSISKRNFFVLAFISFFIFISLSSSANFSTSPNKLSVEYDYTSLSPAGALGGSSIPASCESGAGEGGAAHAATPGDSGGGNCPGYNPTPSAPLPPPPSPPTSPVIILSNGPAFVGLPVSAQSTDPDSGDTIYYIYYDDKSPTNLEWARSTPLPSGQVDSRSTPATWLPGNRTVAVRACDSSGRCSNSTKAFFLSYTSPPSPTVSLSANPRTLLNSDTAFNLTWNAQNVQSCKVWNDSASWPYGWDGRISSPPINTPSDTHTISGLSAPFSATQFGIECKPIQDHPSLGVPPRPPVITAVEVTKYSSSSLNGACGPLNGRYSTGMPTDEALLCNSGSSSVPRLVMGQWRWGCLAIGSGSDSPPCSALSNTAPQANAGSDQSIIVPQNSVTLPGSATDADDNFSIASLTWEQVYGPSTATIQTPTRNNSSTNNTVVNGLTAGQYVFKLTATDTRGASHADEVRIFVYSMPPSVMASITPSTVATGNTFNIEMTSRNVYGCRWSRNSTTYPTWGNEILPGGADATSYNSGPLNFQPGEATYIFTCRSNITNAVISASASITVTNAPPVGSGAPTMDNVAINRNQVITDGTTRYTITATASAGGGGAAVTKEYVRINNGNSATPYRGYLGWSADDDFPAWTGIKGGASIPCGNGGFGAVNQNTADPYGSSYINLVSCSTSISGTTRTVSFRVAFNTNFLTPTNNILHGSMETATEASPWGSFDPFAVTTSQPPTIDGVTINSNSIMANGITQYVITAIASDSIGGGNIGSTYVHINRQGVHAGEFRGYLGWSNQNFSPWTNEYKTAPLSCGPSQGFGVVRSGASAMYLDLVSCNTTVVGNTRTTNFVVKFNDVFDDPLSDNTLSGMTITNANISSVWRAFDTFNLAVTPPDAVILSANPLSPAPNQKISLTWDILGVTVPGSCTLSSTPVIAEWNEAISGAQVALGPHTRNNVSVNQAGANPQTEYRINCDNGTSDSVTVGLKWKIDGKCESLKGENVGNSPADCKNPGFIEI